MRWGEKEKYNEDRNFKTKQKEQKKYAEEQGENEVDRYATVTI